MGGAAVIALVVVVQHDLPIRRHWPGRSWGSWNQAVEFRGFGDDFGGEIAILARHRGGIGIEVEEDEFIGKDLNSHGLEAKPLGDKAALTFGTTGGAQAAVVVVGPGVIGAGDDAGIAAPFEQFMGSVLADIVEATQLAIAAAHHQDILAQHAGGNVVARVLQGGGRAGKVPGAKEYMVLFLRERFRGSVNPTRQSVRQGWVGIDPHNREIDLVHAFVSSENDHRGPQRQHQQHEGA